MDLVTLSQNLVFTQRSIDSTLYVISIPIHSIWKVSYFLMSLFIVFHSCFARKLHLIYAWNNWHVHKTCMPKAALSLVQNVMVCFYFNRMVHYILAALKICKNGGKYGLLPFTSYFSSSTFGRSFFVHLMILPPLLLFRIKDWILVYFEID